MRLPGATKNGSDLKPGLEPAHRHHVTARQPQRDLRRVARKLNTRTLTVNQYRDHGLFDLNALKRLLGPWYRALNAVGLRPAHYRGLTNQELFDNLEKVWMKIHHQPRIADLRPPISELSAQPYLTRFRTWSRALRAFETAMNPGMNPTSPPPKPQHVATTHINWRLRYQILQRDHFRCCACGKSRATHRGIQLQIDHKHPRSQGGPSTEENLQTLCNQCNSGKGDLPL